MKLTTSDITKIINKQKEKVMFQAKKWLEEGLTRDEVSNLVHFEFFSKENDIRDRREEFSEDIDCLAHILILQHVAISEIFVSLYRSKC